MVKAGDVAASTVLGAFALLTARNLRTKPVEELEPIKEDETNSSLSSRSINSTDKVGNETKDSAFPFNDSNIGNEDSTSFELVTKIAENASKHVFSHISSEGKVTSLEATPGTIDIVYGAATSIDNVSIVTSSDILTKNIPELQKFGQNEIASTWHIGCNSVEMSSLKLYTDYSILKAINFVSLIGSTPQEVFDFAILAHFLASQLKLPVGNVFDGVSARNQETTIDTKTFKTPSIDKNDDLVEILEKASVSLLRRPFSAFSFQGPMDAEILFVCLGSVSPALLRLTDKVEEIAVLTVKLFHPFRTNEILKSIPNTCKRICVVEYAPTIKSTVLFGKVASAIFERKLEVDLFSTIINSIEISEVDQSIASMVVTNGTASNVDRNLIIDAENAKTFEDKLTLLTSTSTYGSIFGFSQQGSVVGNLPVIEEVTVWQDLNEDEVSIPDYLYQSKQRTVKIDSISEIRRTDIRLAQSKRAFIDFDQFGLNKTPLAVVAIDSHFVLLAAKSVAQNGKLVLTGESKSADIQQLSRSVRSYIFNNNVKVFYSKTSSSLADILDRSKYSEIRITEFRTTGSIIPSEDQPFINRRRPRPTHLEQDISEKLEGYKLAWNVLFKDSYQTKEALRPNEYGVSIAKVLKFERLTPDEYNRNIFHIEFDISGTGLKYEIGDALGVFGENDEEKVDDFISSYGLNPDEIVALPSRGEMETDKVEYMSVKHLLMKKLDIFGKVPKRFYVDLAGFATSRYERLKLLHTGTDDAELFKLGSWETVTPGELLLQYKSCKLSIADMINIIPEIKARHYSISSAMKMSPNSVHLLVVAVDWVTPLGKTGEGQCTRFLKHLTVGQKVCVDIQKSVLRLPPNPEQPIVMAGLGTGMAPFRAFVQQRYFLKRMGVNVGPMVLYFGARHKAQEWLYGEELEKYERMGLLRLGLAWSRDQKHKIYIQHKIQEDSILLKEYLKDRKGYFYLCGPTWPVPDVRDAINSGLEDEDAVANLKEEGRYILEVY